VDDNPKLAANELGTVVISIAEMLALDPELLGSSWIYGYNDGLLALLMNDCFDDTFALLLGFE